MRSFGRFTWIWLTTVVGLPFVLRAEPGTPADTPSATVGSTNASATAGSAAGTVSQAPGAGAANKSVQPSALVSYEVEQIAKLKQAGVEVSVLQAYVEHSTALRPPNADEIVYLHDNGVPNEVLTALIRRGNELGTQAEQAAASRTQTAQATPPAPAAPSTPAPAALTYPAYDYSYPVDVGAAYPAYTWTSPYWYWWSTPFYSSYYYYRPCGPVARPTYCPPRIHGGIQASVGFGRPLGTGVRGPRPAFGAPAQHSGLLAQHSGLPDRRSALLGRRSPLLDRHSALLGRRSALLDRPSALLDRPLGSATGAAEGFRQRLRQIAVLLLAGQVTVAKPCHSSVWWARFRLFRHNLIVLPVLAEVIHAAFAPILPTRLGRLVLRKPQSNRGADNDSRKCRTNSPLGKG